MEIQPYLPNMFHLGEQFYTKNTFLIFSKCPSLAAYPHTLWRALICLWKARLPSFKWGPQKLTCISLWSRHNTFRWSSCENRTAWDLAKSTGKSKKLFFHTENDFWDTSFSQNVHPCRPLLTHPDGRLSACERQGSQVSNEESLWRFKSNQSVWNFISFYSLVLCSYIRLSKLSTIP